MPSALLALLLLAAGPNLDAVQAREQAGDDRGALKAADALVKAYPSWALARLEAARLRLKLGIDDRRAEQDLQEARRLAPENPRAHYLWALVQLEKGKQAEAIAALERTLELRDSYVDARAKLAGLCFAAAKWECALQHYRALARANPSSIADRLQVAATLVSLGRLEEAEEELAAVIAANPDHPLVKRRLAELYESTGRPEAAEALRAEPSGKKMRPLQKSKR